MYHPWVNPNALYELHKVREQELFAKAKESRLLEAAKNARTLIAVGANRPRLRHRFLAGIGDFLVSFGLWLK